MQVIDHQPHGWFLLKEGNTLFLDVRCNFNFLGYSWAIQLNQDEEKNYQAQGHSFIQSLAEKINSAAPIQGKSWYSSRHISSEDNAKINSAIEEWQKQVISSHADNP